MMEGEMKIVVVGGTGRIGAKVSAILRAGGHDVLAAAPSTGVNAVTGEGVDVALAGAQIVIDVSNSPSFADGEVMRFFRFSTFNLIAAAKAARVQHYVALSVVGTDGLQESGYFRAKLVQEQLIEASGLPYTIVRATQFFEFVDAIAGDGAEVRVPTAQLQPILSDDVAAAVADAAAGTPVNGIVDVAGPEMAPIAEFARRRLVALGDGRTVSASADASYFGLKLADRALVPGPDARIMPARFDAWLDGAGAPR
jgi:uncharacterized protein YbjT (DUF2867 family)